MSGVCGTGSWGGPLPGDPDNNVYLSATATYGGITVSWTMPTTYPHAVAHFNLYRGVTTSPDAKLLLAVVAGNQYFDQSPDGAPPRYYYWLEVVSINGTVGALIGPATAQAQDTIADLITRLSGQINESALADALRSEIARIEILNTNLLNEIAQRINDGGDFAALLAAVQAQTAEATTYIYNEINARTTADAAMLDSFNILATALNGNMAAYIEVVELVTTGEFATAESVTLLTTEFNDGLADANTLIATNNSARVSAEAALATSISSTAATFETTTDAIEASVTAEATARANADSALSTAITTAQTTLNGNIASAQTTLQTNINTVNGKTESLYTAKLNVNGYISGFGIYSDGVGSSAIFNVDTFSIGKLGATSVNPFMVSGGTVYIKNAMIDQLTADKIDSRNLTIKNGAGTVIFSAGVPLTASNITPASGWLNSGITINANGTLSGAGGGGVSLGGLGAGVFATLNQITAANVSTYIASAAIGGAYIGTAAIGSAHIGDLQVTSIKIGNGEVITGKLALESATAARSAFTSGATSVGGSAAHTLQTLSFTATGGVVNLNVSALLTAKIGNASMTSYATHTFKIFNGGTELYSAQVFDDSRGFADYLTQCIPFAATISGAIAAGAVTLTLKLVTTGNATSLSTVSMASMVLLESKR